MNHYRKNHIMILSSFLLASIVGGLLPLFPNAVPGYASVDDIGTGSTSTNSSVLPPPQPQGIVNVGVTSNQLAAGGPLPGNHSLALEEVECANSWNNPPWYPTVNPAELADSNRTHVYPCAHFTGSFTSPNNVYAYASPVQYYSPIFAVTRGTDELYVYGGGWGNAIPKPSGPFVAKLNVGDLTQLWRTDLMNLNATTSPTGVWNYIGGLDVLADGSIAVIANSYLYKLNASTGAVEAQLLLPTGDSLPSNTNFNGVAGWDDGTLVMKSMTRPPGCTFDGPLPFNVPCPGIENSPNSVIVIVDSQTWDVLDWAELPGDLGSRVAATTYNGNDYAYMVNSTSIFRYIWDGDNITLDNSWKPPQITKTGQTSPLAPMVAGEWVFDFTNGYPPANVSLSVVSVSQDNASEMNRIDPIPIEAGQQSYIPSNSAVDPVNNMMYVMDAGVGKIVGLKYDPLTGNMSTEWSGNQTTLSFLSLIGPSDQRVLVGTNIHPDTTMSELVDTPPPTYTEQVQWRDAATGELLAASDYFSGMSIGSPPAPGFGGLLYYMTFNGHIMALQVLPEPATNPTSTTNMTSTTTTAGQNSISGAG
jgi:hypothetical protein